MIKKIFTEFQKNEGFWVVFSSILGKILGFVSTIILARIFSLEDFGILTIALNFINFFIPMVGLGSGHGLLRFGAAKTDVLDKKNIAMYAHYKGLVLQMGISIGIVVLSFIFYHEQKIILLLSLFMIIRLFGIFFLEQKKAELRADFLNKKYASLENWGNITFFILGILGAYFWGILGYVAGITISPFCVFIFYKIDLKKSVLTAISEKEFWHYSIPSVLTILVFSWVLLLDVFLVGFYFSEERVALYRLSIIIPANLVFIGQMYTQAIFPKLCLEAKNRAFLVRFLKTYSIIFIPVCIIIIFFGFIFSKEILFLFFKKDLDPIIFKIMLLQMASSILLRIPFGNLLSAVGFIKKSLWIGIFIFLGIVIAALSLLPKGGLEIMAYISFAFNTLGGIISLFIFMRYLLHQNKTENV